MVRARRSVFLDVRMEVCVCVVRIVSHRFALSAKTIESSNHIIFVASAIHSSATRIPPGQTKVDENR